MKNELPKNNIKNQVIELLNQIPSGKVVNYGAIGRVIGVSGQMVGWSMNGMLSKDVDYAPWWRVVAKDGSISTDKLGLMGTEQKHRLKEEGVILSSDGKVDMNIYRYLFD